MKPVRYVGGEIPIVIASDESEPDLANCDGVFEMEEGYIAIDEDLCADMRFMTLMHELTHVAVHAVAFRYYLMEHFSLTEQQADKVDEMFCRTVQPIFVDMLVRNGWLKPPVVK